MVKLVKSAAKRFMSDESGATLIEYSLMIGLISVALIAAVTAVGGWAQGQWTTLNAQLNPGG